jgi:hypothetical protein
MGFFDPAYKKMLAKSPAFFQQSAEVWLLLIEDAIVKHNAVVSADLFRATVIGHLALESSEEDPANWSSDGLKYIKLTMHSANRMMSNALQLAAFQTATTIYPLGGRSSSNSD